MVRSMCVDGKEVVYIESVVRQCVQPICGSCIMFRHMLDFLGSSVFSLLWQLQHCSKRQYVQPLVASLYSVLSVHPEGINEVVWELCMALVIAPC